MYPSTSLFIAVGQLAIVILVLFSYPLQVHPCRNCLDQVFKFGGTTQKLANENDTEEYVDDHGPHDMSPLKHTLLTTGVILGTFSIAYFVDDLKMGKFT